MLRLWSFSRIWLIWTWDILSEERQTLVPLFPGHVFHEHAQDHLVRTDGFDASHVVVKHARVQFDNGVVQHRQPDLSTTGRDPCIHVDRVLVITGYHRKPLHPQAA
jgi:hypothetical protein